METFYRHFGALCFLLQFALTFKNRGMTTEAGEEDQLDKATKAVGELYELQNYYFPTNPHDKIAKLRSQFGVALKILDSIPLGKFRFRQVKLQSYKTHFNSHFSVFLVF